MRLERRWAPPVEILDRWGGQPGRLAKYPLWVYWEPPTGATDSSGFRLPPNVASLRERYAGAEGRRRVFCFGGSTTYGIYCDYGGSYPAHLEATLEGATVFNFGINSLDSKGELRTFVENLRRQLVPDDAVFLSGINEKSGWLQARAGLREYEEIDVHYEAVRHWRERALEGGVRFSSSHPIARVKRRLVRRHRSQRRPPLDLSAPYRFVADQSESYLRSHRTIQRIAEAWGVRTHFFLQPMVWDVWSGPSESRHDYMKALYRSIRAKTDAVVDISKDVAVEPKHFIDEEHLDSAGNRILAETIGRLIG